MVWSTRRGLAVRDGPVPRPSAVRMPFETLGGSTRHGRVCDGLG